MAGEADNERLIVLLEARIRDFEKNMARASGTADRQYGKMRRSSRSATRQMEADMARSTSRINQLLASTSTRIGAFGKASLIGLSAGAAAALAPILSVGAALNGAKDALAEFDRIGKAAKASGLDSEFFQGLEHAAMLGGVGVSQLSQALAAFNRNAGMAAIGKGELVEKLRLLNPELLKNIAAADTQEKRLRLVADALAEEDDASRRAAIGAAAFGDAGVKMIEMLKGGSAALDETARKARALGLIVDRDLIARSEELNDEFSTATRVLDMQFKQALVNLAPVLIGIATRAAEVASAIRAIVDSMRALEDRASITLGENAADNDRKRLQLENEILELRHKQREVNGFTAEAERRLLEGTIAARQEELDKLTRTGEQIETILKDRFDKLPPIETGPAIPEIESTGGTGGGGRNAAAAAAIREAEAVRDLIEDLKEERALIGASDIDREKALALRQAGTAATAEQRAEIEALIDAIWREREAMEGAREAAEFFQDAAFDAFRDLIPKIETGNKALDRFLDTLIEAVAQAALLGKGPLAGMFGGGGGFGGLLGFIPKLFGFSQGTANTGGNRGDVRGVVHGQEAVIPLPAGGKVPVQIRTPAAAAGRQAVDVKVTVGWSRNADGNLKPFVEEVSQRQAASTMSAGIAEYDRSMPTRVSDIMERNAG